jgi:hypothetical protein
VTIVVALFICSASVKAAIVDDAGNIVPLFSDCARVILTKQQAGQGNLVKVRMAAEFSDEVVAQIIEISERILKKYTSTNYDYLLGLGQSPTPFMARLKAIGLPTYNLPLSGFRNHPIPGTSLRNDASFLTPYDPPLSATGRKKLFDHFAKFLPPPSALNSKRILMLDVIESGASLVAAREYVKEYYKENGTTVLLEDLPLAVSHPSARASQLSSDNIIEIGEPLRKEFQQEQFDLFSEFGAFDLKLDRKPYQPHIGKYQELVNELGSRAKSAKR